jgi:hypothetical protein
MKRKTLFNLLPVLSLALALSALLINLPGIVGAQELGPQAAMGTAFTYQGRLTDGDEPANGTYDFRFIVYSAALGGAQAGNIVTKEDVTVTDGFFTVQLDCGGDVFTGDARYLEIGVRPGDSTGNFTTLAPRQPLLPAPYALHAPLVAGAVMFFNLDTCPPGWHELTEARGRYLVGLPDGGTLGATVGTALSDSEDRPVGRHTHDYSDPGHDHSINDPGHRHYTPSVLRAGTTWGDETGLPHFASSISGQYTDYSTTGISINSRTTGITINYTGSVSGTNAPYMQLLACEKD